MLDRDRQADTLTAATRIYRAWEAENMLDGDVPSTAGPSAVEELVLALFRVAQINPPVLEEGSHGDPAL